MAVEHYALRFISGKDHGREVNLPRDREIIVGRAGEVDLLILDDKVSRRHAKISIVGDRMTIVDLESRNGVFVDGERIRVATLAGGEEIQIGSSTIRLVAVRNSANSAAAVAPATEPKPSPVQGSLMTGSLADVALPDLLQLFVNSRKSGVLTMRDGPRVGRIYLREGRVCHASVEGDVVLPSRKAFFRILRWTSGTFDLTPPVEPSPPDEITETTTALLFQGLQELDELRPLEHKLPAMDARLSVPMQLPGGLRDLATEELQVFQLVLHHGTMTAAVDHFLGTDLEAAICLLGLLRHGFIVVGDRG